MKEIKAVGLRILVKLVNPEVRSSSGLMIQSEETENGEGIVVDYGEEVTLEVEIDDVVIYAKHSGDKFQFQGTEYRFLKEEDILGIISDDEETE